MDFPRGFNISGLKDEKNNNFALVYAPGGMRVSGMFTRNTCPAHPVIISRERLRNPSIKAILVNKGSANAATGAPGRVIHDKIISIFAGALNIAQEEILPASTGVIGRNIEYSEDQIVRLAGQCESIDPQGFAEAIMTTDTVPKICVRKCGIGGKEVRIAGIAKGAGMIAPNMATMLAFILTDACIGKDDVDDIMRPAVDKSFNRLTVDGDTSTNDTVFMAASGAAGNAEPVRESADYGKLRDAVDDICRELAVKIATDGEGATKFIRIDVAGLKDDRSAAKAAKAVANSPLCKTAFFGESPNWGRIVSAIGAAGIEFRLEDFILKLNGEEWILSGEVSASAEARVRSELKKSSIDLSIRLGSGPGVAEVFTCDLSPDYVKINAGYLS